MGGIPTVSTEVSYEEGRSRGHKETLENLEKDLLKVNEKKTHPAFLRHLAKWVFHHLFGNVNVTQRLNTISIAMVETESDLIRTKKKVEAYEKRLMTKDKEIARLSHGRIKNGR